MIKILEGQHELKELKPFFDKNKIWFPVSVKVEYIEDDGLTFGYPSDYGYFTTFDFDYAIGALADDTIELAKDTKLYKESSPKQPHLPDEHVFDDDVEDEWTKELDPQIFQEYYAAWPHEVQKMCNDHRKAINAPVGEYKEVMQERSMTIYRDSNEDYFFKFQYHYNGLMTKANNESVLEYFKKLEYYRNSVNKYKSMQSEIKQNIELLRNTL